jgi:diadenosine tetraphosphate (Ap4A) HIT family hydrolase
VKNWPDDWDERRRGKDCAMCREGRPNDNGFGPRILEGRYSDAYLQRVDVGHPGYSIVIWRGRHVAEPTELTPEEASGYFAEVVRVTHAIEKHYRPIKMNLEMLGNSLPHLHTHVIPRYVDDGAPGTPAIFMSQDYRREVVRPDDDVAREADALRALLRTR